MLDPRKQTYVRFWAWINQSPVKLTLHLGKPIQFNEGGPCDEGYSYSRTIWMAERGEDGCLVVIRHWENDSQDCDGRHWDGGVEQSDQYDIHGGHFDEETGIRYPAWREVERSQRDYYAEAMGY